MTSYNSIESDYSTNDRPLFGESTARDRLSNVVGIGVTSLLVLVTCFGAFIKSTPPFGHSKGYNVFFAICIFLLSTTHAIMICWYRQGDVDPKFRYLIYANNLILILLCICANLFIYSV